MAERDEALIPGATAAQWDGRARVALAAAVAVIPLAVIGVALGATPSPMYLLAASVLFLACFVAWLILGEVSARVMRAELRAGYSTLVDASGYALRHPRTGAVQRAADVEPVVAAPRRSFLLDAFRLRTPEK